MRRGLSVIGWPSRGKRPMECITRSVAIEMITTRRKPTSIARMLRPVRRVGCVSCMLSLLLSNCSHCFLELALPGAQARKPSAHIPAILFVVSTELFSQGWLLVEAHEQNHSNRAD